MSAHKQRYKNVGLDSSEMRRRREEEGIQLRKQKREQQLIKRRNVDNFQTMDNELENTISVCEPIRYLDLVFPPRIMLDQFSIDISLISGHSC